jgi:hypothetical protein
MEQLQKPSTRKKFLMWGAAILSAVTFSKYFTGPNNPAVKENSESNTIKMLTQDGKLVEIDKTLLASSGKKISNEELQQWIKK